MATIVTIAAGDLITNSRADINTNFANLNSDKIETSVIDTDTAMTANSDAKIPSQKAVKTYIDTLGGANASETARGIVEEATDAEVTAGTATGGTGAKLVVTPAKLATRLTALGVGATALTLVPQSAITGEVVRFSKAMATNTTMFVGQIVIPFNITVNKITIRSGDAVTVAGPVDLSLYTEDGQTRKFSVTTASIAAANTLYTTAVSSVALTPGIYYIAINTDGTTNVEVDHMLISAAPFSATEGMATDVASEPVMQGTVTITASTPATTITPTSITELVNATLLCRLDN